MGLLAGPGYYVLGIGGGKWLLAPEAALEGAPSEWIKNSPGELPAYVDASEPTKNGAEMAGYDGWKVIRLKGKSDQTMG